MQTVYRIKAREISMSFLKTLKTLFADKEVIITVESVEEKKLTRKPETQISLLGMIAENRENAPTINSDIDIRQLIDDSQYPAS